jgi:hypothetical protein
MRTVLLLACLTLIGCSIPQAQQSPATKQMGLLEACEAAESNAVAANDQFLNKRFLIVCVVRAVEDSNGISLEIGDGCRGGRFGMAQLQASERTTAATLKPGQVIVLDAQVSELEKNRIGFKDGKIVEPQASLASLKARGLAPPWVLYAAEIEGKPVEHANSLLGSQKKTNMANTATYQVRLSFRPNVTTLMTVGVEDGKVFGS